MWLGPSFWLSFASSNSPSPTSDPSSIIHAAPQTVRPVSLIQQAAVSLTQLPSLPQVTISAPL
jgi:hypothetical protein